MEAVSNLKGLRTERLRDLIEETEGQLAELNAELDRREEEGQHREIEQLDEHMKSAEVSLTAIRDFIAQALSELRGKNASQ